jgi:hypothetical protein
MSNKQKRTELIFAEALAAFDIETVSKLLHDKGIYPDIVNSNSEKTVKKDIFLNMLTWKFNEEKKAGNKSVDYYIDQCNYCKKGCNAFIFEEGKFPVERTSIPFKEKTGLVLIFKDDKIFEINLCSQFLKTKNRDCEYGTEAPF